MTLKIKLKSPYTGRFKEKSNNWTDILFSKSWIFYQKFNPEFNKKSNCFWGQLLL